MATATRDLVSALEAQFDARPVARQTAPYDASIKMGALDREGFNERLSVTVTLADAVGTVRRGDLAEFSEVVIETTDSDELVDLAAKVRTPHYQGENGTRRMAFRYSGTDGNRTYTASVRPIDKELALRQLGV